MEPLAVLPSTSPLERRASRNDAKRQRTQPSHWFLGGTTRSESPISMGGIATDEQYARRHPTTTSSLAARNSSQDTTSIPATLQTTHPLSCSPGSPSQGSLWTHVPPSSDIPPQLLARRRGSTGLFHRSLELFRRPSLRQRQSTELDSISASPAPQQVDTGLPRVPSLAEKYGNYIIPERRGSIHKAMGATSRKNIASGATAVIRLVRPLGDAQPGLILAVKEFKKRDKQESKRVYLKRMHNEYCIGKTASGHPNVVATLDLVMDEQQRWCTVMEYCAGGDLFSLLAERSSLSHMEQACLFKQLLLGLQHLHHLGIAHRDIKPENLILTTGGTLKIADFGVADVVQTPFQNQARPSRHWCGSSYFWSPEIWTLKNETDGYDGRALDIWSAAITFYCIRFGNLPFTAAFCHSVGSSSRMPPGAMPGSPAMVAAQAPDGGDPAYGRYVEQRMCLGELECDLWSNGDNGSAKLSHEERICMAGMLDPDPALRWTVDQALASSWMANNVEMCDDGALPNGWRHYHCMPTFSNNSSIIR